MTTVPEPLGLILDAIEAPIPVEGAPPTSATGRLAQTQAWWAEREGSSRPQAAFITASGIVGDAINQGLRTTQQSVADGTTVVIPSLEPYDGPDDIASRALIATLANREASSVCFQPEGMTDAAWMDACTSIRRRSAELAVHRGETLDLLDRAGSSNIAYLVGVIAGASAGRVPVLLDSTHALAAALIVDRLSYRAKSWWGWASTSPDPARQVAADRLGFEPLLDLQVFDDATMGARAALAILELAGN